MLIVVVHKSIILVFFFKVNVLIYILERFGLFPTWVLSKPYIVWKQTLVLMIVIIVLFLNVTFSMFDHCNGCIGRAILTRELYMDDALFCLFDE